MPTMTLSRTLHTQMFPLVVPSPDNKAPSGINEQGYKSSRLYMSDNDGTSCTPLSLKYRMLTGAVSCPICHHFLPTTTMCSRVLEVRHADLAALAPSLPSPPCPVSLPDDDDASRDSVIVVSPSQSSLTLPSLNQPQWQKRTVSRRRRLTSKRRRRRHVRG